MLVGRSDALNSFVAEPVQAKPSLKKKHWVLFLTSKDIMTGNWGLEIQVWILMANLLATKHD